MKKKKRSHILKATSNNTSKEGRQNRFKLCKVQKKKKSKKDILKAKYFLRDEVSKRYQVMGRGGGGEEKWLFFLSLLENEPFFFPSFDFFLLLTTPSAL